MSPRLSPELLQTWKDELQLDLLSWIPLVRPLSFAFYSSWLAEERHGGMEYLKAQSPLKEDPSRWMPTGKSALVAAVRYKPHPAPLDPFPRGLRIASYARGRDYHEWLEERMRLLGERVRGLFPDCEFLVATDSKPVLERDLAYQAGLGWIGKNTCLIHPEEGSFLFIAETLLSLECDETADPSHGTVSADDRPPDPLKPLPDFCGKCRRCLDACPTGALLEPRLLDARKCISYWTIEAREAPPPQLREKIGDWFFGCDVCQDVCPWNEKVFRARGPAPTEARFEESGLSELRFFLTASNREIERTWGHTPLLRARPRGLRRNALIVAANRRLTELAPEIRRWSTDPDLGELATWALARLESPG